MPKNFCKDKLYALPLTELVDFSFDEKTVAVFPDMINRSVPGYSLMQSLTGLIANKMVVTDTRVYDLGCSLGASSLSVINSVNHHDFKLILIDQSESMLSHCRQFFSDSPKSLSIEFIQSDVRDIELSNASMVILNLVLQFLPHRDRYGLLKRIHDGLNNDGALLLSEKIDFNNQEENLAINKLYVEFKKRSGYSDLEISQKRRSLEKVMQTESVHAHIDRLNQIGFKQVIPVFQALNFVSILAIK